MGGRGEIPRPQSRTRGREGKELAGDCGFTCRARQGQVQADVGEEKRLSEMAAGEQTRNPQSGTVYSTRQH